MESVLEKLKRVAKANKEKISKSQLDNEAPKKYNIGSLTDEKYLLEKLPKGSLLAGAVDEDGNINVDALEKSLQRTVFSAIKAATKESHDAIIAMREEVDSAIQEASTNTQMATKEQDLVFFPDNPLKERLAQAEYRQLKEQFKDANPSVEDLKAATLENLKDIQDSTPEVEEEEEPNPSSDFSDLLADVDLGDESSDTDTKGKGAESESSTED